MARQTCKEQIDKYKKKVAILQTRPTKLSEFAAQVESVLVLQAEAKEMKEQSQKVEQMYSLLTDNDVKVHSDDMLLLGDLHSFQQDYAEELDAAKNFKSHRMAEMTGQLDGQVAELNKRAFDEIKQFETANGSTVSTMQLGNLSE